MAKKTIKNRNTSSSKGREQAIPTQTIARAVDILKLINMGPQDITGIAQQLGISKSTAYRLLFSLEKTGMAMRDRENRRFQFGPLIAKFSANYLVMHENLCICADNEMNSLRNISRETIALFIQIGVNGMYLNEHISPEPLRYSPGIGELSPLYAGAGEKVILSEVPFNKLQLILDNLELKPMGPNTIVDKDAMMQEVADIKERGYATAFEEKSVGGASIAVPIKNYTQPVALCIIGPSMRLAPKMMGLLNELMQSANKISDKLLKLTY